MGVYFLIYWYYTYTIKESYTTCHCDQLRKEVIIMLIPYWSPYKHVTLYIYIGNDFTKSHESTTKSTISMKHIHAHAHAHAHTHASCIYTHAVQCYLFTHLTKQDWDGPHHDLSTALKKCDVGNIATAHRGGDDIITSDHLIKRLRKLMIGNTYQQTVYHLYMRDVL